MSCVQKGKKLNKSHKQKIIKNLKYGLSGKLNPNWQGGKSFIDYPKEFNNELKLKIRTRDNFKCRVCGILEKNCKRKLSIHHIDYDKKNCNEDNLISLCNACHQKTNKDKLFLIKELGVSLCK